MAHDVKLPSLSTTTDNIAFMYMHDIVLSSGKVCRERCRVEVRPVYTNLVRCVMCRCVM